MFIDLTHNKIISETISAAFVRCVEDELVPMLEGRFGDLLGIQMYEDHIADGFLSDGEWYYPLTLVFDGKQRILWIKWKVSRHSFAGGNPYAYTGDGSVGFELANTVPDEFCTAMEGRAIFCEDGLIPIRIDMNSQDPTFLSGKYSQTFVDEMARQLTREIARSQAIVGLSGSTVELRLVFAPETYMEHTSENVTYRRLLLTDKGCSPRDFWVKWTRLDGATAYTVSDSPSPDSITFEIGEDVPQKVREREYRYLVRIDGDKFHSAMSRKNVTEWREILRRAIRRGDLIKVEEDESLAVERDLELREQLSAILGVSPTPVSAEISADESEEDDELVRLAREAIMGASRVDDEQPVTVGASDEETSADEPELQPENDTDDGIYLSLDDDDNTDDLAAIDGATEEDIAVASEDESELVLESESTAIEEESDEPEQISVALTNAIDEEIDRLEEESRAEAAEEDKRLTEERIRAEIEAKLRLEYESRARAAAEEEAARLRREQELLRQENERLLEKARRDAEAKAAEEARLKAEIEAKLRQEAREKERLAEAAMIAMEERRRLEAERAERERAEAERAANAAAERARAEEQARVEAARAAEADRIRREREKAEEVAKVLVEQGAPKYISRTAEFTFRRIVDPNITKRIYEIVKATIEFYHKEDVYIRIKASVPDSSTVKLEFLEVPEEEGELVVNIIKALGKSDLGIAKATLD